MQNRISVLVALEGSDEDLKSALGRADAGLQKLSASAKTAGERASASFAQARAGADALAEQFNRAKAQLVAFLAVFELQQRAREVVALADAWNQMEARLKLATAGSREFTVAQQELYAIAQRIGVPLAETASLYGKLQQAVRQLGGDQRQALDLTESIAQALRLSGASAEESRAALLQFGQALASGVLRGEEFNSVVENSPRLAQALADGLNVPIGRLRKLAEQGQLTADVVVNALLSQKGKLAAEYATLPVTVSQAFTRLENAFGRWIHEVDQGTGFTRKLGSALDWLSQNLDTVMTWLRRIAEVGLAVLIYRLIPALITAWQTAGATGIAAANGTAAAWALANQSVGGAVAAAGALRVAFATLGAFIVGWEIGTWLSEKFAVVRQAGVLMVSVIEHGIEELRHNWEVFAAIFTDDTIEAATARHQARLAEMNRILHEMLVDAGAQGQASRQAMDQAAAAAEEIAKRLAAVRQGTQEAVGRGAEALAAAVGKVDGQLAAIETRANHANQTITQSLAQLTESYRGLTELATAGLAQALDAEAERHRKALAALNERTVAERSRITETSALFAQTIARETQLRRDAVAESLRLTEEEYTTRRAAAGDNAANAARVESEMLAVKRRTLAEALTEYRRHVDALNAESERHLEAIRRIEDEKRALSQSTEERIRDLRRAAMSEIEAYQDKQTQIAQLQSKARTALMQGEYEQAKQYAKQAADLASQSAQAVREGDQEIVSQKVAVKRAIDAISASERISIEALDQEAAAHREAADTATRGRQRLNATLRETQTELDAISARLKDSLTLTIDADTRRFHQALDDLDKALAEKERLLPIKADLQVAERQLRELGERLKTGETLNVDADVSKAQAALKALAQYAKESNSVELSLSTDKAHTALANVERQIKALDDLQTQSRHTVQSNAADARAEVLSLDGMQTSSTHTIYVQKVETNAVGGMVGAARFAQGGAVGPRFAAMDGGKVPGSGNADTVPRALTAGSFVLRKAAVRHYGEGVLARLSAVRRFARGGPVTPKPPGSKRNREIAEALELIDLGLQGSEIWSRGTERSHAPGTTSTDFWLNTRNFLGKRAGQDRAFLQPLLDQRELDAIQRMRLNVIVQRWQQAMMQAVVYGKNLGTEFVEWKQRQDPAQYFRRGGPARSRSDTVPALLTPGEFVVRKEIVDRLGAGFFETLNALKAPREKLVQRVRGYSTGGLVSALPGLVRRIADNDVLRGLLPPQPTLRLPRDADSAPTKTVRVELAAGAQRVAATIDARDESRLLELLKYAQARAV